MNKQSEHITAQEAADAAGKGCGYLALLIIVPIILFLLASALAPISELAEKHSMESSSWQHQER